MATGTKTILLVDDEPFILELIAKTLERDGFICHRATSAAEAMELLNDINPDIILSDYSMPGDDGFAFRKKLLANDRLKNIPFVFLTAFTQNDMILQGLDLQAVDYIAKDTALPVIISKLNNLLSTVREQHEKSLAELRKTAETLNLRSTPQSAPRIRGFDISFWHKTFQNYPGGDFIDFISISDKYTYVVLGDVMGKQWGAWCFSFNFLSYIRSAVRLCVYDGNISTAVILKKINDVVYGDPVLQDVMSTLTLIMIEHQTGRLYYSGAGDLPLIHYKYQRGVSSIASTGLLLGLLANGDYTEQEIVLNAGDKLLVISDGMIDYKDDEGKKTDYDLFVNRIKSFISNKNALQYIKGALFSKQNNREQIDDCSIIIIEKEKSDDISSTTS
ncbi:fused response regulator/phosphatase [Pedobacter sp. BS3]|uniref:PP2C family protein-serine/threonine phosphatase n=1 Tax=Pedobacter sp. BS3 TaxID=2567937 RepID=UPI0011EF6DB2|nr:fused response regulator/phosphatase [Pedobacter sp. BS3]TZF84761.1 fused response regulator/phosphatase [Pedobacter sp. BS3]